MNLQQIADVLVSSWTLAEGARKPLPTTLGVLDRALQRAISQGNFPEEFRRLRFVPSRVGVRCPELNRALSWAQAAEQTSDPNPSYSTTTTKFSENVAIAMLDDLGIPVEEARNWGRALADAIKEEKEQIKFQESA